MRETEQFNEDIEATTMRRLIDLRLKARLRDETLFVTAGDHPDDDVVNAFVEGQLSDDEAFDLTSHLVSCSSCLHLTAQLIRFEPEMDEVGDAKVPDEGPGPLQRIFDRLAAGVIPSMKDDAVFAYEEKQPETNDVAEKADGTSPDRDAENN